MSVYHHHMRMVYMYGVRACVCVFVMAELIREFEIIGSNNLHIPEKDTSTASVSLHVLCMPGNTLQILFYLLHSLLSPSVFSHYLVIVLCVCVCLCLPTRTVWK